MVFKVNEINVSDGIVVIGLEVKRKVRNEDNDLKTPDGSISRWKGKVRSVILGGASFDISINEFQSQTVSFCLQTLILIARKKQSLQFKNYLVDTPPKNEILISIHTLE